VRDRYLLSVIAAIVGAPTLAAGAAVLNRVPPSAADRLVVLARRHGVETWLAACAPPEFELLRRQRPLFLAAQARTAAVLATLRDELKQQDCPWMVLKGPALGYSVYPRPDLRQGVDLDVLVPPPRFGDVLVALESAGFTLLDGNWPLFADRLPGALRVRAPQGVLVDLHWAVLDAPALRGPFRLPVAELLQRARWLEPPGVRALSAVDQLVHLGVHGALSGANRLVWLLDAHLAAGQVADWDEIVTSAHGAGAGPSLALVLTRARRLWRTPVPPAVLRALGAGPLWRALDRMLTPSEAVPVDPGRAAPSRAWARATRATRRTTLAGFARHGRAWVRSGRPRVWQAISFDESDPGSPVYRADDPYARRRYLAAVADAE
jgi:putative nucleotidyltransferase-like protein